MNTLCFDLETTGTDQVGDRIIEIGIIKTIGNETSEFHSLVNPGVPLPPKITELTGIKDDDLKDAPAFSELEKDLSAFLQGEYVVTGYNIGSFDVPFLESEYRRLALDCPLSGKTIVDPCALFKAFIPHTLEGAVQFYVDPDFEEGAQTHRALDDVRLSLDVLNALIKRHELEYASPETLQQIGLGERLDWQGHFKIEGGQVVVCFGKHKGTSVLDLKRKDPGWTEWATTTIPLFRENAIKAYYFAQKMIADELANQEPLTA